VKFIYSYVDPFPGDGLKIGQTDYKGLAVKVFGRHAAEQYEPESNDEVCISIRSASQNGIDNRRAKLSGRFKDILYLVFDDTTVDDFYHERPTGLSTQQAEKIADFVVKHRDRKKLVLHCYAGMNRSRSTAEAICRELKLPFAYTINNYELFEQVRKAIQKKLEG
jgi:predicted protein tyrosine phosphatase